MAMGREERWFAGGFEVVPAAARRRRWAERRYGSKAWRWFLVAAAGDGQRGEVVVDAISSSTRAATMHLQLLKKCAALLGEVRRTLQSAPHHASAATIGHDVLEWLWTLSADRHAPRRCICSCQGPLLGVRRTLQRVRHTVPARPSSRTTLGSDCERFRQLGTRRGDASAAATALAACATPVTALVACVASLVYHPCTTPVPPLYHLCITSVSPLYHLYITSVSPLYRLCITSVSPLCIVEGSTTEALTTYGC